MAKSQAPAAKESLDKLLDRVSDARETLISVERTLEHLRFDIAALDKRKSPREDSKVNSMTQNSMPQAQKFGRILVVINWATNQKVGRHYCASCHGVDGRRGKAKVWLRSPSEAGQWEGEEPRRDWEGTGGQPRCSTCLRQLPLKRVG